MRNHVGGRAVWGSLASEERLVVAALVGFALLLVAGTYQSWPLPLAIALTVVMLGVAVLLASGSIRLVQRTRTDG